MDTLMKNFGARNISEVMKHPSYKFVSQHGDKGATLALYYFRIIDTPERMQGFFVDVKSGAILFPMGYQPQYKVDDPYVYEDILCETSRYYIEHCRLDEDILEALTQGDRHKLAKLEPTLYALYDLANRVYSKAFSVQMRAMKYKEVLQFERIPMAILGKQRQVWVEREIRFYSRRKQIIYRIELGGTKAHPQTIQLVRKFTLERIPTLTEFVMLPENLPFMELYYARDNSEK
ncbi:hypothetical protein G173_gp023 [Erwinia phage phiEaH2]|uniref:Uncharacterized protein n=1 Tax=Erwinia phage phiEaH2 TaxID=1029988 RepID=J7KHA5_9CAUD|nr:hypothetical protein G173_gp023 [Erwinia phage phiEaH2]AFQ96568.1 hypothetical protein [Erwinia phage phiEaH2]